MNTQQNKDQTPAEDWLETYASDVEDNGLIIKDAMDRIVDAMRNGDPADPNDIAEAKSEILNMHGNLKDLEDGLNKLPCDVSQGNKKAGG